MWEEKTGVKPSESTCRKRYTRLKANLTRVSDEDLDMMKTCADTVKAEVEEEKRMLDRKLWARISDAMEQAGTQKYEAGTVEKAYKLLVGKDGSNARSSSMAAKSEHGNE